MDHQLDQEAVVQQPSMSVIGVSFGGTPEACQKKGVCYSALVTSGLHLSGVPNDVQPVGTEALRPSTQVDYGESAKTPGKSSISDGADHRLDHGGAKTPLDPDLQAIVAAWDTLPQDVRKMIVGVVKLTPKAAH